MPGYKREREYIRNKWGLKVETCYVAHVKEELGLTRHKASEQD